MVEEIRKCNKCGLDKLYPKEFIRLQSRCCKICRNLSLRKPRKIKEKVSKEHKLNKIKEWQKNNPEKRKEMIRRYHEKHYDEEIEYRRINSDKINKRVKEYRLNNRVSLNEKLKIRRKNPLIKLRHNVSSLVRFYLNGSKQNSILKYLTYTIKQLKQHLESQFEPWMSWNNHGLYIKNNWDDSDQSTWTWQIDHIIPHSTFKYTSMEDEEFKKCWSLDNLRPYSAKQNLLDGVKRERHL